MEDCLLQLLLHESKQILILFQQNCFVSFACYLAITFQCIQVP